MKKRMMALAMAAAMVLGACGGNQPAATTAAPAATEAAKTEAAKAEETKAEETKAEETKAEAAASEKGGMEGGTALNFTTGGDQGTYYGFGGVLAGKVGETTSTTVTAITSGGSAANIEALDAGDAQLGFVQSDVMAYAHDGIRLFEETGAVDTFSTVAALYMEQVQIVTLDENIKSVADLKGKNVSIGAAGSGVYFNAIDCLAAYDMTEEDIKPTYQSFGDSTEALQDGKIDAAFVVAGAPTTAVTSLAATKSTLSASTTSTLRSCSLLPRTTARTSSPRMLTTLLRMSRPSLSAQWSSRTTMSPRLMSTTSCTAYSSMSTRSPLHTQRVLS